MFVAGFGKMPRFLTTPGGVRDSIPGTSASSLEPAPRDPQVLRQCVAGRSMKPSLYTERGRDEQRNISVKSSDKAVKF